VICSAPRPALFRSPWGLCSASFLAPCWRLAGLAEYTAPNYTKAVIVVQLAFSQLPKIKTFCAIGGFASASVSVQPRAHFIAVAWPHCLVLPKGFPPLARCSSRSLAAGQRSRPGGYLRPDGLRHPPGRDLVWGAVGCQMVVRWLSVGCQLVVNWLSIAKSAI
jgi:hypothetical protein